jgi:hypothetical protein
MIANIINEEKDDKIKQTRNRLTKKEQFIKERLEFINNLNNLLNLNDDNNNVFLYEIENNQKIKDYINENIFKIKTFFKCGTWGYFSNSESKGKNNFIGLIRSLYTDSDYEINSKLKVNTFNNLKKQYTLLTFKKIKYN